MDSFGYKYLVAIRCMTFLHANYITDALNGFCMQQTEFPYVCMVVDDASTDGEQNVIREYIAEHFVVTETRAIADGLGEYVIAKHKINANCDLVYVELSQNLYRERERKLSLIRSWQEMAKYEALCEGDDYWTDPLKLQKQVDFLESHPDFSMCFHRAKIKNECNANTSYARCEEIETKEYFANDMCPTWIVPTASVVYRYPIVSAYPLKHRDWFDSGDIVLFETCAHVGRIWGMEDAMSVYRMNAGSLLQNPQYLLGQVRKSVTHYRALKMNFPLLDADCMDELTGLSYYRLMKLTPNVFEKLKCLVFSIYYNPSYMWSKIIKLVRRK